MNFAKEGRPAAGWQGIKERLIQVKLRVSVANKIKTGRLSSDLIVLIDEIPPDAKPDLQPRIRISRRRKIIIGEAKTALFGDLDGV